MVMVPLIKIIILFLQVPCYHADDRPCEPQVKAPPDNGTQPSVAKLEHPFPERWLHPTSTRVPSNRKHPYVGGEALSPQKAGSRSELSFAAAPEGTTPIFQSSRLRIDPVLGDSNCVLTDGFYDATHIVVLFACKLEPIYYTTFRVPSQLSKQRRFLLPSSVQNQIRGESAEGLRPKSDKRMSTQNWIERLGFLNKKLGAAL